MSRLLVRNIRTLVSCDGDDRVYEDVDLVCENGLIRAIAPGVGGDGAGFDQVIDGTGMLCYPGLVNAHHHLYQVFSRNLPQVQNMELFDWLTTLYEVWKNLNEDTVRLSSLVGIGELMKNGCTTVFDHHYVFPQGGGDLLAQTGTGVCHCPISNMKLASGIARVPEMLRAGVPVGLGVDGSASNDGSNLLEEMRVCYLLHRLNSSAAAPDGYDVLKMATMGSARLLGRGEEIGSLEVGKCADFFMVDSRRLELVGACYDSKSVLATVGLKGAVDWTVVNGRVTVEHGRLTGVDEEKVVHDAEQELGRYLAGM